MTLPDERVMELLADRFVLGNVNIQKQSHVGMSHGYGCSQSAVGTTNGAGGRNVQIVVMTGDGIVLHALPGFWHADDLLPELELALELEALHRDDNRSAEQKRSLYFALHRAFLRTHAVDAERRGAWQDFDRHHELARAESESRDTVVLRPDGSKRLKSIVEIVHDRLLSRVFVPLDEFDMESFVDYGRPFYDNNWGDRGKTFRAAEAANRKREQELARERKQAAKAAAKAARAATE